MSQNLIRIESDETGHVKAVTFDGKVLPVMEFTLHADAKTPVAQADLVMLAEVEMTAVVGQVSLFCQVCSEYHKHLCTDNPAEQDQDDFH